MNFCTFIKYCLKLNACTFFDISGENFAVVQKEKKQAAKIDTPEEVNESPMDSNDPPMTAASPTPEEDSQNFPKIQENRDFVDQARVSNDDVSRIYEFTNIFVLNDQLVSRIFCHYESTRLNIVIFIDSTEE